MADLIVVCGPQAVGKMTVAESLRDKLHYNMMMNHDSIEISDRIFGFGTPAQQEFNRFFREKAFELAVEHDVDMIFTYVCAFEMQEERDYLTKLHDLFTQNQGRFFFVELFAGLEIRLARNETPHRMERKASKRDLAWSRANLLHDAKEHRLNSEADEIWFENHLKIDNSALAPDEVADRVIEAFGLKAKGKDEKEYRFGV
ncbi:MAG: AAA family ATPase [Lachnospiraceae bacterium]|nr:AAA family ATPase [Lachnospiraceae bacterium]